MGLFKKIFKPVRKVLDKVVPNEIKPALPYLAAFTPFMAPTTGFMGTMTGRALLSGGANIAAQLAQEGTTEDDLNLLSAGIAAATGALSAPGASAKLETFKSPMGDFAPARNIFQKGRDLGITGLQKASNFLSTAEGSGGVGDILRPGGTQLGFNTASATALGVPLAQGTGDAMYTEAVRLSKEQIIDDALSGLGEGASDADRALAIRTAMLQYGFGDDEIEETITAAGYKAGGRVGFETGGPTAGKGLGALLEEGSKYITKKSDTDETDTINRIYEEQGSEGLAAYLDRNPDLKDKYVIVADGMSGELTIMPNKLHPDNREGELMFMLPEMKAKGGRVGFRFGGIDEAIEMVEKETVEKGKEGIMQASGEDPMLVEEYNKYVFDLLEQRPNAKPMSFQDFKRMVKAGMKKGGRVKAEEGGLMDLGGKEMDLRGGGFVPIGKKERADDVPARLSKNEFVMTADAVRGAGGGDINKGAKRMYETMNNLEARA